MKKENHRIDKIESKNYDYYMIINSYETLNKILDSIEEINYLPEKIMHDFILATIQTVINDVLEMNVKSNKYCDDILNFKLEVSSDNVYNMGEYQILQRKLEVVNNLIIFTEKTLDKLLNICLYNDNIKYAIRFKVPALYENIYCLIDGEDELKEYLFEKIIDNCKLNKEEKLKLINDSINEFIENVEEYIDLDKVENKELVQEFYKQREKLRKRKCLM